MALYDPQAHDFDRRAYRDAVEREDLVRKLYGEDSCAFLKAREVTEGARLAFTGWTIREQKYGAA